MHKNYERMPLSNEKLYDSQRVDMSDRYNSHKWDRAISYTSGKAISIHIIIRDCCPPAVSYTDTVFYLITKESQSVHSFVVGLDSCVPTLILFSVQ